MPGPDHRLLVPASALPFVPGGALLWTGGSPRPYTAPWTLRNNERADALLDLSAPALRHGIPERLDALDWALAVLSGVLNLPAMWYCSRVSIQPYRGPVHVEIADSFGRTTARIAPGNVGRLPIIVLDPWPDLAGLSPDDAARAVVAAAIRGRRSPSP